MQANLETLGQLERRLNVAVPLATIEGEVKKRLERLAKTVKVPGFRPGKVPIKLVTQQYGPQVRSEVITETVQSTFANAVREQNLRVAGYPRIEPSRDGAAEADSLQFSAVFEVYPEVRIGELATLPIERPQVEVAAADVERTIEVLRKQRAKFASVDRGARDGDRVVVDFTGTIDGVEFPGGQARDFPIVLGEGRMLPEFEAALAGAKAGDARAFPLTFPADYHGKEVAGKEAHFSLTVKEVTEPELPPVDEAFAKAFGVAGGSVDELRAEIAANLRLELKRKVDALLKEQALKGLRERADFALPRSLVEMEASMLMERMANNLRQQGMKPEDVKLSPDLFRPQAEERVGLGLLMAELVRSQGLSARPEQVRALVEEIAQTYEQPDAVVRWHYEKPERLSEFEGMAMERNVVDWVIARAKVIDKPMTFEEVMGPARS